MSSINRQQLPAGLNDEPGPALCAALDTVEPWRLTAEDTAMILEAWQSQVAYTQARFMEAMVALGSCRPAPPDTVAHYPEPPEHASDEVRVALTWTRRAAENQFYLALDLQHRIPAAHQALLQGRLDLPRAKVLTDWTRDLTPEHAQRLCGLLLPEAMQLTTGQLTERAKQLAIAMDPDFAARRYRQAIITRRITGYRNPDGTANISGLDLPLDQAAAACAHIEALARRIKQAGHRGPIDHIRADLFLAMLDGTLTGWTEAQIVKYFLTAGGSEHDDPDPGQEHPSQTHTGRPFTGRTTRRQPGQEQTRPGEEPARKREGPTHPREQRTESDQEPVQPDHGEQGALTPSSDNGPSATRGRHPRSAGSGQKCRPRETIGLEQAAIEPKKSTVATEKETAAPDKSTVAPEEETIEPERTGFPRETGPHGEEFTRAETAERGHGHGRQFPCARQGDGTRRGPEPRVKKGDEESRPSQKRRRSPSGGEAAGSPTDGPPDNPRTGIRLRVRLSTLLDLDRLPAELPGWGHTHAEHARHLVTGLTGARWRYTVCDEHGTLLHSGPITARPSDLPRRTPVHGGAVEIQVPLTLLERLHAEPGEHPPWARVIDQIVRDLTARPPTDAGGDHGTGVQKTGDAADGTTPGERSERRFPTPAMRRRVQTRDRHCVFPGCRMPAHDTDTDHVRQWQHEGLTQEPNLVSLCRHDHRLKDTHGWRLTAHPDGTNTWTSPLGLSYTTRRPPVLTPLPHSPAPRPASSATPDAITDWVSTATFPQAADTTHGAAGAAGTSDVAYAAGTARTAGTATAVWDGATGDNPIWAGESPTGRLRHPAGGPGSPTANDTATPLTSDEQPPF